MSSSNRDHKIETLFSAEHISERVDALAQEIVADEPGDILVVIILKGSFVFAADLVRALERNGASAQVDFVTSVELRHGNREFWTGEAYA